MAALAWGAVLLFGLASAAAEGLKGQLVLTPGQEDFRLLVKFRADAGPDLDSHGRLHFLNSSRALGKAAASFVQARNYRRVVEFKDEELWGYRARFPAATFARKGFDLLDFAGLVEVQAPDLDKHGLLELGRRFEALDEVEYATLQPAQGLPPPVDLAPTTADYNARQGWLGPSPGSDCRYGWTKDALGQGITVRDIEDSWGKLGKDSTHEDFDGADVSYGSPAFNSTYDDHGMAIFGMILGQHNGYGIQGCAPKAAARGYSFQRSTGRQDRPGTLARMVADSKPGDIILLEMQAGGLAGEEGVPADIDVAIWDLTKQATAAGVVVLGTAGNGGGNLDGTAYTAYRGRGDNGVIMVGAGSSNASHTRMSFSSYGRCCVHVQGWGQNVVTTGYGDLANLSSDNRQKYTSGFNGTSSAGGHLAGITALVQSYAVKKLGKPLTSLEMRALFLATGLRQGTDSLTGPIGPLPNVRAALDSLDKLAPVSAVASPHATSSRSLRREKRQASALRPHRPTEEFYDLSGKRLLPGAK